MCAALHRWLGRWRVDGEKNKHRLWGGHPSVLSSGLWLKTLYIQQKFTFALFLWHQHPHRDSAFKSLLTWRLSNDASLLSVHHRLFEMLLHIFSGVLIVRKGFHIMLWTSVSLRWMVSFWQYVRTIRWTHRSLQRLTWTYSPNHMGFPRGRKIPTSEGKNSLALCFDYLEGCFINYYYT